MDELGRLYTKLLEFGLLFARQALDAREFDWARAQIDLLHNIPSLLNEPNWRRHEYFWNCERTHYLEWLATHGTDMAKSQMRTYFLPIWNEMEPIIAQLSANNAEEPSQWSEGESDGEPNQATDLE